MKELFIIIIIIYSLINFAVDYLSNDLITHNELITGIVILLHHFIVTILLILPLILFYNINNIILVSLVLFSLINQVAWLTTDSYCPITQFQNILIKEEYKNYKWVYNISGFIKKYIHGDEWAYSEIRYIDRTKTSTILNLTFIFYCLKKIIFK